MTCSFAAMMKEKSGRLHKGEKYEQETEKEAYGGI